MSPILGQNSNNNFNNNVNLFALILARMESLLMDFGRNYIYVILCIRNLKTTWQREQDLKTKNIQFESNNSCTVFEKLLIFLY